MKHYQVFHSPWDHLRKKIHCVFVRPESGGNQGAVARAMANMGFEGSWRIVGAPNILNEESKKFAKHAAPRLETIQYFETLSEALKFDEEDVLKIAATARIGSPTRPHPLWVDEAITRATEKLQNDEITGICFVFGPESDGLTNEEVSSCDWVATIPSTHEYRSLNLAQSFLIFLYEVNKQLMVKCAPKKAKASQKKRLIRHILQTAEDVGFILPGDPFKMRPKLEGILQKLPHHIEEAETLHGLLDQVSRSVKKGAIDFKGRYKRLVEDRSRNGL